MSDCILLGLPYSIVLLIGVFILLGIAARVFTRRKSDDSFEYIFEDLILCLLASVGVGVLLSGLAPYLPGIEVVMVK